MPNHHASEITIENKSKYKRPPTWDMVQSFADELGMDIMHFERFYGIPYSTLTQVKNGRKPLPIRYWHIFYERVTNKYGAGFIKEYEKNKRAKLNKKYKNKANKKKKATSIIDVHDRLSKLSNAV